MLINRVQAADRTLAKNDLLHYVLYIEPPPARHCCMSEPTTGRHLGLYHRMAQ